MLSPHPMVSAHFPHENCDSDHFWGPRLSVPVVFVGKKERFVIQIGQTSRCGVSMVLYGLIKLHYQ